METKNKIITGGIIVGAVAAGITGSYLVTDYAPAPKAEPVVIERQKETISHSEFLRRIEAYNGEILEVNKNGIKFVLKDIDGNNTIIDRLNDLILK